MKKVYICSPYRGDIERNTRAARRYCLLAIKDGYLPIAPHLIFTEFLDDSIPEQREQGILMGLELLDHCNEIWVFGSEITEGMKQEILFAKTKPYKGIRYFTIDCLETDGLNGKKKEGGSCK